MYNQVSLPVHCSVAITVPACGRMLLNGIFTAGGLGPHVEACLCMGQLDELKGQLPMQSLYLMAQQENLLSLCCALSPDVARTGPTCTFMSCPLLWAT